ncbi:hypothetical protein ACP70R_020207 [Stipagrostis hirtigluma subsp. patula]
MISGDLLMLIGCVGGSLLAGAVGGCFGGSEEEEDDDDELPPGELEVATHARPPSVEAAQMASIAVILLDYVTFLRQNDATASASCSASASGGDGSTEAGASSATEDCAICLGPLEDGEWFSVMPLCRHEFHRVCIAKWLLAYNNTCPLCRAQLQWSAVAEHIV